MSTKRITFDIKEEDFQTYDRLQAIAKRENRSMGAQIRHIIREWVEKQPKELRS